MKTKMLASIELPAVFIGVCFSAGSALGAGGPLHEPLDKKQVPNVWQHLANERMIYPMDMADVAVKIGPEHQLFVDNCLIAKTSNITREVHQPVRHKDNPVFKCIVKDGISTTAFVLKVLKFDQSPRFRMWYWSWRVKGGWHRWKDDEEIRFATSYAVSEDGVHWERPELNLHHIEGSPEKNIVIPYGLMHGIFYEPWEKDPQKRFKALVCVEARKKSNKREYTIPEGYYLHTSPDGIHWKADRSHYVIPSLRGYGLPQGGIGDTSRFWWDPLRKKYIGDVKFVIPGKLRCRGIMESDDLIHWTRPHPTFFARDPANQIYGHTGFAYEGMYIGVRWIYKPKFDPETHSMDVELDCSRDGKIWTRVGPGQPFMALNPKRDTWDASRLKPTTLMLVDDEIWIYYAAAPTALDISKGRLSWWRGGYSTGLAKLRRDGFASLNASETTGTILTRPLGFAGNTLHVNAQVAKGGWLRAGFVARNGPVKGFTVKDCKPVTDNGIDIPVSWKGGSDISALSNSDVRIEFKLKNAKLYAFWIE